MNRRCAWAGTDPLMVDYHDREWGVPVHDDRLLFEFLVLEGAQAGLSFVAVTAGLFGVAEVLASMATPTAATPAARVRFRELYPSREELRRAAPAMARGTLLGFLVGLIPGPAATLASFVSYGVERKVGKHRDELGTGAIEGVAGPEAANNAAAGGGMIPLLSLGLPFTPSTAVLLSGMLLMNVTPGPFLLRDHPSVFWGVIGSFYVGNVMLLLLNLPLVGFFARIATIPPRYLMPGVLVLCAVAAYADNNNAFDVWILVGAGLIGWGMRALDYSPAPLVLGLVLGPLAAAIAGVGAYSALVVLVRPRGLTASWSYLRALQ